MREDNDLLSSNILDEIEFAAQYFDEDYVVTNGSGGMFLRKKISILDAANIDDTDDEEKHLLEETKKRFSSLLQDNCEVSQIRSNIIDNPKERVVILFNAPNHNIYCDLDVPLDISANDLVIALNDAYKLGIDISDINQCFFRSDNPIALIRGKKLLGEFGIRDGSLIIFDR